MNDSISRKAAIDALCDNCDDVQAVCAHYPCKRYIAIEKLPSAQPERKKGHWIEIEDEIITGKCSVCGWDAIFAETDVVGMPYCPNCGADMRGDEDEVNRRRCTY